MKTEELVSMLRDIAERGVWRTRTGITERTITQAADRLEAILGACAELSSNISDGGMGTIYLRDNDQSRKDLAALRRAITGES